mmetsp:Transcript_56501/g.120008  ORF Transcript_56501/g.120008 Transcript_56501/m.120008 type:complete len:178 (+) Transcript_56501:1161-1694(+)
MLKRTIEQLIPNLEHRPTHAFFIDRGYLQLAQEQDVDVSNIIQILRDMGVKFLGTIKDSFKYPFYFVEVNEEGKTAVNNRAVVQTYGMRDVFAAISRHPTRRHYVVLASAYRFGQGKSRAARLATIIPEVMCPNLFVYKTNAHFIRKPHQSPPSPLPADAGVVQKISHAFLTFESSI